MELGPQGHQNLQQDEILDKRDYNPDKRHIALVFVLVKSHAMEANKEGTMSKAPFSLQDADNTVGSSHVLKKHFSLNNLLRGRQPKAKVKNLFEIVAVALLLLSPQLTACTSKGPPPPTAPSRPCCHLL